MTGVSLEVGLHLDIHLARTRWMEALDYGAALRVGCDGESVAPISESARSGSARVCGDRPYDSGGDDGSADNGQIVAIAYFDDSIGESAILHDVRAIFPLYDHDLQIVRAVVVLPAALLLAPGNRRNQCEAQ
jgi:hypothetical protein